jgi:L-lactate dehydrogenase complex protein LldG
VTNVAREEVLGKVRAALGRTADSVVAPIPATARFAPRLPGDAESELALFLGEAEKIGAKARRLSGTADIAPALRELVQAEPIKKATLWQTAELQDWGVEDALQSLGVEIVSPYASNRDLAQCDLGITGADFALPETGTLVLRSAMEKPRTVSLLPPVHLAIIRPAILRADLHQVFDAVQHDGYFVFVTGPSRTSDIELTLTVGVHGPKAVHIWALP